MATRLYRIGTVFSRVDGAVRKGLIKENNIPIWVDVYRRFPPKYEPIYTKTDPGVKVIDIFYEEDVLRAEIHKICGKNQVPVDLSDHKNETQSQKLLKTCQQYIADGMTKEDALKKIKESLDVSSKQKGYKKMVQETKEIYSSAHSPT